MNFTLATAKHEGPKRATDFLLGITEPSLLDRFYAAKILEGHYF